MQQCYADLSVLRPVSVIVSAYWTVSGVWWRAMGRLISTSRTVPCRRSVSGASSAPRVPMQTAWDSLVSEMEIEIKLYRRVHSKEINLLGPFLCKYCAIF